MPKEKENNKNEIKNNNQIQPETAGESSTKGKNKETEKIVESLDLVVKSNENIVVASNSESKKNLKEVTGTKEVEGKIIIGNELYWMKPKDRKELAESFYGVDRILYDKLEKKTGTIQSSTGSKIFTSAAGFLPLFGGAISMGAADVINQQGIMLEQNFSIDEVKEIIVESQKENNRVIEGAKNYIMRMADEKNELEEANEQLIKDGEKKVNEKLSEQAKENNEKLNKEKNKYQKELTDLTTNLVKEKEEATEKAEQEKNNFLNKQKTEYEQKISDLNAVINELQKSSHEAIQQAETLKKEASEVLTRIANSPKLPSLEKIDLEKLSSEHKRLKEQWETNKNEKKSLEEQKNQLEIRISEIEQEIISWKEAAEELERQKQELTNKYQQANEDKEYLVGGLNMAKLSLEGETKQLRLKEEQIATYERIRKEKDANIDAKLKEINQLSSEKGDLELKLNDKTRKLENHIEYLKDRDERIKERNEKVDELLAEGRNTALETIKKDNEIRLQKVKINAKQAEIKDLTNALEVVVNEGKEKDKKLADYQEKYRLKIEEYNELKNNLIPQWFQNLTYWVGVEDAGQIWGKGVVFGRILLFFLIAAVIVYIFTWIIRVLAAIVRNTKKIFGKKQDTASILKELIGGMKQAKEKAAPKAAAVVEVEPVEPETEK